MPNLNEQLQALKNEENADQIAEAIKSVDELHSSNKSLYSRTKTAEGFEKNSEGKWVKKEKPVVVKKKEPEAKKSDEPDYSKIAYLNSVGVKHPDDQKVVQDEAKRLDLPLTDVLGMKHIKSQLKDAKDQREAEGGSPDGKGKKGGGAKTEVDYWIDKKNPDGTYATPKDQELAGKVINARVKKEESKNQFSEILYDNVAE